MSVVPGRAKQAPCVAAALPPQALAPMKVFRFCIVEVEVRGRSKCFVSCVYPVEESLSVRTRSETIDRHP